jgi:hypothetical protein
MCSCKFVLCNRVSAAIVVIIRRSLQIRKNAFCGDHVCPSVCDLISATDGTNLNQTSIAKYFYMFSTLLDVTEVTFLVQLFGL